MEEPEESDTEDQTDNIQSSDIYKVQLKRDRFLKSLALSILKYLSKDILREESDFSSIKSNDTIQDCEMCQECDKPILTENPPRSLVLNVCGDIIHQTCAGKPDKRGVLECSCGIADDKDLSLSSEEMDIDEKNNEDGEVESTLPEKTDSASNSKSKKQANENMDSSASKKFKKRDLDENSNILKRLIRELSSDTTQISVIKEKKGLQRESMQEDRSTQIFFDLYFKITNAEERNEKARHELIIAYYHYGEELEKRLVHYREGYKEHEALKKLYDEVKDQLPKEVTKNAIRKKSNRARKVYDLFFCITNDKIQRMVFIG
ncbi:11006_t:CDS:1 [Funneliformis mosseae]|uniref:11006_t:CDS:1 n=1 Tax=Funneliformis mosseae TaxID=27381 RepID=A0A9N9EUD7_FUNMO|nr:11006_t:CDS:1 [Funneliformis mosseae]